MIYNCELASPGILIAANPFGGAENCEKRDLESILVIFGNYDDENDDEDIRMPDLAN